MAEKIMPKSLIEIVTSTLRGLANSTRQFGFEEQFLHYVPDYEFIKRRRIKELARVFSELNEANIKERLEEKVFEFAENMQGARISVGFYDLKGRLASFDINGDALGWSASTIKVAIMIETFRALDHGEISLDDKLEVDHKYTLEPFDPVTRMDKGSIVTVRELIDYMIIVSDNEASNMLTDRVGLENINQTMQELGANRTMIAHLLAPSVPRLYTQWNPEGSNLTTANDLTRLMVLIYTDCAASIQSCAQMREILEKSSCGMLGAYLPSHTLIGNKIGAISDPAAGDDVLDVGVINRDYVVTVMCNRIGYKRIKGIHRESTATDVSLYWNLLRNSIDLINHTFDLPFYFDVQARPVFYFKPSDPTEVIGIISKAIHDIYYKGRVADLEKK